MNKKTKIVAIIILISLLAFSTYSFFKKADTHNNFSIERKDLSNDMVEDEYYRYETPSGSVDDCSSYEDYDEESGVCYYECKTVEECKSIENSIDEELSGWTEEMSQDNSRSEYVPQDEDIKILSKYNVYKDEAIKISSGKDLESYRDLWIEIAELSPNSLSDRYIESYQIFDNVKSDTLAFVDENPYTKKWRIVVNIGGKNLESQKEQKATLVHELGHIISLNSDQLLESDSCSNLSLQEGCAKKDSYINNFYNRFWKGLKSGVGYSQDNFVSEYASSEPVEDFAESFAFFVLGNGTSSLTNIQRDQKIVFFYNFPELIKIRSDMRSVIGAYVIRSRKLVH